MADTTSPSVIDQIGNGVKIFADLAVMPGTSRIVEGKVVPGLLYGLAGVAAKAAFGPIGWIAAGLDSYSVSSSGRHLWDHLRPGNSDNGKAENGKTQDVKSAE